MNNAWIDTTERGMRFDRVDRGMSYGGASLQACVLVLLFAAACEWSYCDGQRSTFGWDPRDGTIIAKRDVMAARAIADRELFAQSLR